MSVCAKFQIPIMYKVAEKFVVGWKVVEHVATVSNLNPSYIGCFELSWFRDGFWQQFLKFVKICYDLLTFVNIS